MVKQAEIKVGSEIVIVDAEDVQTAERFYLKVQKLRHAKYCVLYKRQAGRTVYAGLLHRAIMNAEDGTVIDHINGDGLDNRRSNLRAVTNSENICNRHSKVLVPKTGLFGVYEKREGEFYWEFTVNKRRTRKGGYSSAIAAAIDRETALKSAGNIYARSNRDKIREAKD